MPRLPQAALAHLAFDFEHPLEAGSFRMWVDKKLVYTQDLEGHVTKELAGIKIHKGTIEAVLDVSPGRHVVRVRIAWEDNVKEESLSGSFTAGSTRRLEIRLGLVFKNLSVEWK